ncbi:MAG: hypothetical protein IT271_02955 [Chitinophagales bacterium]|nr:hypothetical protein [Chitinophagales bacterium]
MKINVLKIEERQQQLRSYFLQLTPDTDLKALDELVSAFEMDSFPKNHLILKQGEFSDNFYFISKAWSVFITLKKAKKYPTGL